MQAHNDARARAFCTQAHNHTCTCALLLHHRCSAITLPDSPPSSILCCQTYTGCETQTHTHRDSRSLGAELGNHAAAPLARLIKPGHLCLIPHLEQVAASPAVSFPLLTSRRHRLVTAPLNNDDCKGANGPRLAVFYRLCSVRSKLIQAALCPSIVSSRKKYKCIH